MTAEQDERLDRIATILLIAFEDQIDAARERIRADVVTAEILDATSEWVGTAELQRIVAARAHVTDRTVRSKLSELRDRKLLLSSGQGAATQYKSAGVI